MPNCCSSTPSGLISPQTRLPRRLKAFPGATGVPAACDSAGRTPRRCPHSTRDLPPPDLIVRTSGEVRLSNFMLWQAAYAELLFVDTLWPDFDADALAAAVESFAGRDRRYGAL